jgi:hypothetical protein
LIRNCLSELDLIDWKHTSFQVGGHDLSGKQIKGKACKWEFSAELMQKLSESNKKEEERESLYNTTKNTGISETVNNQSIS